MPFEIETYNYPVRPANDNHYLGLLRAGHVELQSPVDAQPGAPLRLRQCLCAARSATPSEFGAAQCWDKIQMRIWHSWVPRVHAAFDLFGDGKSVIKGGFGRFVNLRELNPEVVTANRNNRATSTWIWRDLNNNRDYDRGEVNLDPNGPDFRGISGVTDAVPNPNENQPKSDEWSLTFERELRVQLVRSGPPACMPRISICVGWRRSTGPTRPTTFPSRTWIPVRTATSRPPPTMEVPITYWDYPAGLTGRNFAGTMLVNWPGSQTYKTIEVAATKRMSNRWQANMSFSVTRLNSPFDDRQPLNPNSEINTANDTGSTRRRFPAVTFFRSRSSRRPTTSAGRGLRRPGKHQFTGGAAIRSIVLNVEPLGSIRLPNTNLVDFRFAKRLRIGTAHTLEGRFDFFNVFNANFVTGRNLRSGSTYSFRRQSSCRGFCRSG